MSLVESLLLPERKLAEGDLERQLNDVMDRGLETYIRLIAAKQIAGGVLGLNDDPISLLEGGIQLASPSSIQSIFSATPRSVIERLLKVRFPL